MTLRDEIDRALRSGESPSELADRLALGDPVERVHVIEAVRHFAIDADLELADRCSPLLVEASGLPTPADVTELAAALPPDPGGVDEGAFAESMADAAMDPLGDAERHDLETSDLDASDTDLLDEHQVESDPSAESFVEQQSDPAVDEQGLDGDSGFDVFD